MLTPSIRSFIDTGPLAHLVTIDEDGGPQVSVAWVGRDGDELLIGTLFEQRKLANIRRDPRVALSFQSGTRNGVGMEHYLVISGRATLTDGGAPELLQELAHTYVGPDAVFPPMPEPPSGYTIRITPTDTRGVGPWQE